MVMGWWWWWWWWQPPNHQIPWPILASLQSQALPIQGYSFPHLCTLTLGHPIHVYWPSAKNNHKVLITVELQVHFFTCLLEILKCTPEPFHPLRLICLLFPFPLHNPCLGLQGFISDQYFPTNPQSWRLYKITVSQASPRPAVQVPVFVTTSQVNSINSHQEWEAGTATITKVILFFQTQHLNMHSTSHTPQPFSIVYAFPPSGMPFLPTQLVQSICIL